ncbi:hypothetical protein Poly21_37710 [Allorhodopirellula heiligendammensis]|uniref:Uncharacterized protein n=1 Tax=Allorhodopirellula heiligendammensis TaxID=2714739 RepID=A0A5C6BZ56_9BACT|nr:hypothetical protein Poly21_37710 [Allorhodopirellula heiligendammensis]
MLRRTYLILGRVRFPLLIVGIILSGLNVHEQIGRVRFLVHRDSYRQAKLEVIGSDFEASVGANRLKYRHKVLIAILEGEDIRVDARVVGHQCLTISHSEYPSDRPHSCDVLVNMRVPPGLLKQDYDLRVVGLRSFGENCFIKTLAILTVSNLVLAAALVVFWYHRRIGNALKTDQWERSKVSEKSKVSGTD